MGLRGHASRSSIAVSTKATEVLAHKRFTCDGLRWRRKPIAAHEYRVNSVRDWAILRPLRSVVSVVLLSDSPTLGLEIQ